MSFRISPVKSDPETTSTASGRTTPVHSVPPSPTGSMVKIFKRVSVDISMPDDSYSNFNSDKETGCCAPEEKAWKASLKLVCCVLAGIIFGWCLEKSRVFEPASIRLQMVFRRWVMLKMFLAAVASGQLVLCLVSLIPKTKQRFNDGVAAFGACFTDKKGFFTSSLGPFILGSGMTLSGACPGMVLAQVGSWVNNAIYTLVGVLLGALIYGLVAPYVVEYTKPNRSLKKPTAHEKLGVPYAALAFPMALLLGTGVFLMEWFINWEEDLDYYNRNGFDIHVQNVTDSDVNIITAKSWPPSAAGVIIGLLQVVIMFSVSDTLGGSSSYVTIVSQWVVTDRLKDMFPYLAAARCGIGNWWQVFYVVGAVLGGLFSSLASDSVASTKGTNIITAFFGGLMMLLGARLGAGCTSGHGLSGMGLLFWLSFIAVPFMFAGGIVTAFSMDATGALEDFSCHSDYIWMCETT